MSSLTLLIPRVRLRLRSSQFALHRAWDRLDPDAFVRWSSEIPRIFSSGLTATGSRLSSRSSRCLPSSTWGQNSAVAVSADNTTALAFLRNRGGGHQSRSFWAGWLLIFCAGRSAIPSLFCLSSSWGATPCWRILFSRLNPILGSVWTLKLSVFQQLRRRWPVSPDLFATSLTHHCLPYSPFHNSNALGTEVLKPWDGWQAYAFPPYVPIPAIL